MHWLYSLFVEHTALQALAVLSLISAIGLGLGKVRILGVSLGVTFVFFAGILAGHLGLAIDPQMLTYAESFGLVVFVYALGLQVGPGFFSSFRSGGMRLNMLAIAVVLVGTLMALLCSWGLDISLPDMVGILCGATTNTPALGAAQQTLKQLGMDAAPPALGCAVTYPLGVVGVILAILLMRKLLARKEDLQEKEAENVNKPYIAAFQVHNPAIFDKSIKEIGGLHYAKFVISRLWRDGKVTIPTSDTIIREGDRLLVLSPEKDAPALTVLFGEQEHTDWNKEDIDWNAIDSQLISQRIVVTRPELNGRKLGSLHLRNTYGVNITRIYRSGVQLLATADLRLQMGDRLTVVGEAAALHNVEHVLGNAVKSLKEPNLGRHPHLPAGHQCPHQAGPGRRSHHRGHPHRHVRSSPAHDYLYHAQCQPDAPLTGPLTLPGLPGAGCGRALLRDGVPPRGLAVDRHGLRADAGAGADSGRGGFQGDEDRLRLHHRNAVRQHGQSHGTDLCQRYPAGQQRLGGLRHGLPPEHVPASGHRAGAADVPALREGYLPYAGEGYPPYA